MFAAWRRVTSRTSYLGQVTSSHPLGPQNRGSFHRKTSFQVILGLNPSFHHLRSVCLNHHHQFHLLSANFFSPILSPTCSLMTGLAFITLKEILDWPGGLQCGCSLQPALATHLLPHSPEDPRLPSSETQADQSGGDVVEHSLGSGSKSLHCVC